MTRPNQFHRSDLEDLPEYVPARVPDFSQVIKLDANENPYGPSPRALAALANWQAWHYYPQQEELREAVARYVGAQAENMIVSNGADESIDLLLRTVLEPGQVVIDCPPSFEMYSLGTRANRGRVCEVLRRPNFSLDVDEIARACERTQAKVIVLASPNNPDGGLLPRADLERLLELPTLVVLDEAYAEFAGESAVALVARHSNLVILRTFSKWAGLAGLRVGYTVMPAMLATAVRKIKSPYNVNAAGVLAARASLEDIEYLMNHVRAIVAERERMYADLQQSKLLQPTPSRANFLLCRVVGIQARALKEKLAARNILIRSFHSPRLSEYVRLSVGTREQDDTLLSALEEIAKE